MSSPQNPSLADPFDKFRRSDTWTLECFSPRFLEGADANKIKELNSGGKIVLPKSVRAVLSHRNAMYPIVKLNGMNPAFRRSTHAGVLEFSAEEGKAYLPQWMMDQVHLIDGDLVSVEFVNLPRATYVKLKPTSAESLDISNARAILEVELGKFSCFTQGDVFSIQHRDQTMRFEVKELKPAKAATIIDCDLNIGFEVLHGNVELKPVPRETQEHPLFSMMKKMTGGSMFGAPLTENSPKAQAGSTPAKSSNETPKVGLIGRPTWIDEDEEMPEENYKAGPLEFMKDNHSHDHDNNPNPSASDNRFKGKGYSLR